MKCEECQGSDGFTFVTHKKKRKRNLKKHIAPSLVQPHVQVDVFKKSKIESIQKDLKCSEFFSTFKETLKCVLINSNTQLTCNQQNQRRTTSNLTENIDNLAINNSDEIDIVCYGLGHFITCMIARYQLAFLMILNEVFQPSTVCLYDPVFLPEEKSFLKELGLEVLEVNEEAKRTINRKTIFFMPHCDLPLYNNLIGANWKEDSLSKLIIIGNSFEKYFLNRLESTLKAGSKYMYFSKEIVTEVKICNNFQFSDIFNDLSVHYFQSNDLSKFQKWTISDVTVERTE